VPVEVKGRKSVLRVERDDHFREGSSLDDLARLPAAFGKDGSVTAGNASGIVDGGAALILASAEAVRQHALTPQARLVAWSTVGVDPSMMGMGPAPAIRKLLQRTQLSLADVDLFEINEAFAAQYLSVEKELQLDRDRVNVNGGAIALGHPLGMTGTRLLLTLTLELRRRGGRRGIASACIGGGQGIAALVEVT
jgi:acetyl-CoA acyltransferase 2